MAVERLGFVPDVREALFSGFPFPHTRPDIVAGGEKEPTGATGERGGRIHAGVHLSAETLIGQHLTGADTDEGNAISRKEGRHAGIAGHEHAGCITRLMLGGFPHEFSGLCIEGDDARTISTTDIEEHFAIGDKRRAGASEEALRRTELRGGIKGPHELSIGGVERLDAALGTMCEDFSIHHGRHGTRAVVEAKAVAVVRGVSVPPDRLAGGWREGLGDDLIGDPMADENLAICHDGTGETAAEFFLPHTFRFFRARDGFLRCGRGTITLRTKELSPVGGQDGGAEQEWQELHHTAGGDTRVYSDFIATPWK